MVVMCDVDVSPPSPAQPRHRALVRSLWYPSNCGLNPLVTAILYAWVGLYPCSYPHLSRWLTFDWLFDRLASIGCFPQESGVFCGGGVISDGYPAGRGPDWYR